MASSLDACQEAERIVHSWYYIATQVIQVFAGICTFFAVLLTRKFIVRKLANVEAKILTNAILFTIVVHGTIFTVFMIHHLIYNFFFVQNICDCLLPIIPCMLIRIVLTVCTINLSLLFICQCIDRTLATIFLEGHHHFKGTKALITSVISVIISIIGALLVYIEDVNETIENVSCLSNTKISWERVTILYYILNAVNICAFVWMLALFLINTKLENRKDLSLGTKYQIRENIKITKIMLLVGCIQLIVFLIHVTCNIVRRSMIDSMDRLLYRSLQNATYLISYSNCIYPLLLALALQRIAVANQKVINRQIEVDMNRRSITYFNQYASVW